MTEPESSPLDFSFEIPPPDEAAGAPSPELGVPLEQDLHAEDEPVVEMVRPVVMDVSPECTTLAAEALQEPTTEQGYEPIVPDNDDFPEEPIAPTLPQALQRISVLERLLANTNDLLDGANAKLANWEEGQGNPRAAIRPAIGVLLHGNNANHMMTVTQVEATPAGYLVHVKHTQ